MRGDLVDLAERLKRKQEHPREALAAAEDRLRRVDATLNVIAVPMRERAHDRAAHPFGAPFFGAPFLLKDSATAAVAGVRQPLGSVVLKDEAASQPSYLSSSIDEAGLNAFGKTTTPEFSVLIDTYSKLNGITRNPWDPSRTPGGSSGGSAAAVAAGVVPAAHANDGAGSIRLPASFCGLVGLKPTRGRVSLGPMIGESLGGTACEGVLSISVRDTAALLDVLSGPKPGDPYGAPPLGGPLSMAIERQPGRLRIALVTESPFGGVVSQDARDAATRAARLCESMGHEIVEAQLPIDSEDLKRRYMRFYPANCNRTISAALRTREPAAVLPRLDAFQRYFWETYGGIGAMDLLGILSFFNLLTRDVAAWMAARAIDLWLSPTTAGVAPKVGFLDAEKHGGARVFERFLELNPFTPVANLTGSPAISLPLHWTAGDLPVGAQFVGLPGDEALLLCLARQMELASPWARRVPPVSALRDGGPSDRS